MSNKPSDVEFEDAILDLLTAPERDTFNETLAGRFKKVSTTSFQHGDVDAAQNAAYKHQVLKGIALGLSKEFTNASNQRRSQETSNN